MNDEPQASTNPDIRAGFDPQGTGLNQVNLAEDIPIASSASDQHESDQGHDRTIGIHPDMSGDQIEHTERDYSEGQEV